MRAGLAGLSLLLSCGLAACAAELSAPEDFDFLKQTRPDAGSGDASNSVGRELPRPSQCAIEVFKTACGTAACHGSGAAVYIDLESTGLSERLLDVASSSAGVCKGRVFVSSSGGDDLLLEKVSGSPSCGSPMPFGKPALTADQIACLTEYVVSLKDASP